MVDTVLSRDKNWVRWKMENCPTITKDPLNATDAISSRQAIFQACTSRKIRATPMGSLDLQFLADTDGSKTLASMTSQARYVS